MKRMMVFFVAWMQEKWRVGFGGVVMMMLTMVAFGQQGEWERRRAWEKGESDVWLEWDFGIGWWVDYRACGDEFLEGRGDTLYLLYDRKDSLQRVLGDWEGMEWMRMPFERDPETGKPVNELVMETVAGGWVMSWLYDVHFNLFFTRGREDAPVEDAAFVTGRRPATREELVAFFNRERERRHEWAECCGNKGIEAVFLVFPWNYFKGVVLVVPEEGGRYRLFECVANKVEAGLKKRFGKKRKEVR